MKLIGKFFLVGSPGRFTFNPVQSGCLTSPLELFFDYSKKEKDNSTKFRQFPRKYVQIHLN